MTLEEIYEADHKLAVERYWMLSRFAAAAPRFVSLVGAPVPWARAGTSGGRRYTPKKTAEAEALMGHMLKQACRQPLEGPVALVGIFYMPDFKLADYDNLIKLVSDAGNGIAWLDDKQIVSAAVFLEYDPERPRTLLAFGQIPNATLDRRLSPTQRAKARRLL